MEKDTKAIVASNLTIAFTSGSPAYSLEQVWQAYQDFLKRIEDSEPKNPGRTTPISIG